MQHTLLQSSLLEALACHSSSALRSSESRINTSAAVYTQSRVAGTPRTHEPDEPNLACQSTSGGQRTE